MDYPITQPVVPADIPLLENNVQVNSSTPITEDRTCCQHWKAYHNNHPKVLLVNSIHLVLTILGVLTMLIRAFSMPVMVTMVRIVASVMCFVMLKNKSPVFVGLFAGMISLCMIQTPYAFIMPCIVEWFWLCNHAGQFFSDPLFIGYFVLMSFYTISIWITQFILVGYSVGYYQYLKKKALTIGDDVTTEEDVVSPIVSQESVFVPQTVPTMLESQIITMSPQSQFAPVSVSVSVPVVSPVNQFEENEL